MFLSVSICVSVATFYFADRRLVRHSVQLPVLHVQPLALLPD